MGGWDKTLYNLEAKEASIDREEIPHFYCSAKKNYSSKFKGEVWLWLMHNTKKMWTNNAIQTTMKINFKAHRHDAISGFF